jgi:hypothetical protein
MYKEIESYIKSVYKPFINTFSFLLNKDILI